MSLSLLAMMRAAADGYDRTGGVCLVSCFDAATGEILPSYADCGDGLAAFVAVEVSETFDPAASRADQVEEAVRVLRRAQDDLERAIIAIQVLAADTTGGHRG